MAGDWIKMRADLLTHPKIVRMMSALKADKFRIVGGLMSVWCLFDAHSEDGRLSGYTPELLDTMVAWDGFAGAMVAVGWLNVGDNESLELPRFDAHNGQSAKRRAQDADRKRDVRKASASEADKKRTREEKRREEKKETEIGATVPDAPPPADPPAAPKSKSLTFDGWTKTLAEGELAIPEDHYVFDQADKAGLPAEFVELAWEWFKRKYSGNPKRYTDWRQVFANAVSGAWGNLWRAIPSGGYELTSQGIQFRRVLSADVERAA